MNTQTPNVYRKIRGFIRGILSKDDDIESIEFVSVKDLGNGKYEVVVRTIECDGFVTMYGRYILKYTNDGRIKILNVDWI
jgi:hypothetical protein